MSQRENKAQTIDAIIARLEDKLRYAEARNMLALPVDVEDVRTLLAMLEASR